MKTKSRKMSSEDAELCSLNQEIPRISSKTPETLSSKIILDFDSVLTNFKCDPNCNICSEYILRFAQHISETHSHSSITSQNEECNTHLTTEVEEIPITNTTSIHCIKCNRKFKNQEKLDRHIVKHHSDFEIPIQNRNSELPEKVPENVLPNIDIPDPIEVETETTDAELPSSKKNLGSKKRKRNQTEVGNTNLQLDSEIDELASRPIKIEKPDHDDDDLEKQKQNLAEFEIDLSTTIKVEQIDDDQPMPEKANPETEIAPEISETNCPEPEVEIIYGVNTGRTMTKKKSPHICDFCEEKFSFAAGLRRHYHLMHVDKDFHPPSDRYGVRRYECRLCGQNSNSFGSSQQLLLHFSTDHPNDKPYICQICKETFLWWRDLIRHNLIHNSGKAYKCTQCPREFDIFPKLKSHLKRHILIRPFACDLCKRTYMTENQLSFHRRAHSGKNKCETCGKCFDRKNGLKMHMMIHEIVICEDCGENFEQAKLYKHQKKVHGKKTLEKQNESNNVKDYSFQESLNSKFE